jgi:putative SOS response-associated peptidase YedK
MSKTHVDYEHARQRKDKIDTENKTETETETDTTVQTETETDECPWVIQPMRWGLVPSWHSGESDKGVGYNMINARSDGILSKRTFKGPLEKGRRCVVLVDG